VSKVGEIEFSKPLKFLVLPKHTAHLERLVTAYLGLVAGFTVKTATRSGLVAGSKI
jgi:hypothetical protein